MVDVERFKVKQLQREFKYTDMILDRVRDELKKNKDLTEDEYVYQLHYMTSTLVDFVKTYLNAGFDFKEAYDLAYHDFKS